jgi:ubiquinone/menaquinone biosynthesis C-methylase UbiE
MAIQVKDHFSTRSEEYARFRPVYPDSLFQALSELTSGHDLAWDCATGTGQAATALSSRYSQVVATDVSENQIRRATPGSGIRYLVSAAEQPPFGNESIDLVTIAQALHWFDTRSFFAGVERVLKKGGVIAVWTYNLLGVEPGIDRIIDRLYREVVGPYWPAERRMVEEGYRSIRFPFNEITIPPFSMKAEWTLRQLAGYLGTWSACKRYKESRGVDPLGVIAQDLEQQWGDPDRKRTIDWPLMVRVGRKCF